MGEPEPGTPSSGSKRGRQIVAFEDSAENYPRPEYYPMSVPTPAPHGSRSIRRRSISGASAQAPAVPPDAYEYLVYLPNSTSVVVRVDPIACLNLKVAEFVELVRVEQSMNANARSKQKQREITWKTGVFITDFQGNVLTDARGVFTALGDELKAGRGLLLHDNHPDTVHSHPNFWNVTPETHLLEILPQDYSVFSALADELDNSLQAVYQLQYGHRLICVDLDKANGKICIFDTGKGMDSTPQNSISKWGTMGSSMYRRSVNEAIGIPPPYLKPHFGMFGLGGVGAGLHLGRSISVSSKTMTSERVVVLHLAKETLETNVKAGSVWKTGGEFRSPTPQELQWSPHGSFTKVEISNLNREITTWRVEDVQRKLKDFYFPYIQNDDGARGMTTRPVEIRVNGDDLAGVVGGEVAVTNFYSGCGEPYVLSLEFSKPSPGGGFDVANGRITCHYFPINKGREAIDEIIEKLKEEDPKFVEPGVISDVNFENYSRRSIRRLGRLLPRARGGRFPFMEPKKFHREIEVSRHCYKRAKAFVDVDAGFVPTHSKTDLDPNHPFTDALLKLGSGLPTVDSERGLVNVSIKRNGGIIRPEHLYLDYKQWITRNHEKFDIGAMIDARSAVIVSQPHHKELLNIKEDVFRVVYDIKCGDFNWKVGKNEPPIRLKLLKGLPGLNINDAVLFVTVECFISDGLADLPGQTRGETRIICRALGVPEELGSREVIGHNNEHTFILGESRALPIEILFNTKCEVVDEVEWQKKVEKAQRKLPAFIEILNGPASFPMHANLVAGAVLPHEIVAVVRPKIWREHMNGKGVDYKRSLQKYIIAESLEMSLVVGKMKYHAPGVEFSRNELLKKFNEKLSANIEKKYERKVTATSGISLKGLYHFSTIGNELEHITRSAGTYFLLFSLVNTRYQNVETLMVRINVAPSCKAGKWTLVSDQGNCSEQHPNRSQALMRVRLGKMLPSKLYMSRVDEFGNPLAFREVPREITCDICSEGGHQLNISATVSKDRITFRDDDHLDLEIPAIRIGEGNLELLKPTMRGQLRMIVSGFPVASLPISVLAGGVASARMESEPLDNGLHPGQIIEKIIFEVLDSHQNRVSSGEQVKVVLDGFAFQDKVGHTRSVDGNGCLDLAMRLRVTASYGDEACLELRSVGREFTLWKKSFKVIHRSLRAKNVPERLAFGSQLMGVEIEAVDENGEVDQTMDGAAHNLTLDWNPIIAIPLIRGVCILPPTPMCNPGMWDGSVAHAQHSKLKTLISVWVDKPIRRIVKEEYDELGSGNPYPSTQALAGPSHHYEANAMVIRDAPATDNDQRVALEVELRSTIDKSKHMENKLQRLGRKLKKQEVELDTLNEMKEEHEKAMKQYQDDLDMLMAVNPGKSKASGSGKGQASGTAVTGKAQGSEPGNARSGESEILRTSEQRQVEVYSPTRAVEDQVEAITAGTEDPSVNIPGCKTLVQVETQIANLGTPRGTHAAAILIHAQRRQDPRIMNEVLGVVALLAAVENEHINRALSAFLGSDNMLAIICRTAKAAECFGAVNEDGTVDPTQGISGLAQSRNLPISGRFRVISLADDTRFFKRRDGRASVNYADPQKLLNMRPTGASSPPDSVGSLGYAVNLIHLNEEQLRIRIAGRYGLRESLFFMLFGYLEVFDTTSSMLRARNEIRSAAVSLDSGIIRTSNQFEWGARVEPEVCFPIWIPEAGQLSYRTRDLEAETSQAPRRCIPFREARPEQYKQRKELLKAMASTRQRFLDKGVEDRIQRFTVLIEKTKGKIGVVTRNMNENTEKGLALSRRAMHAARGSTSKS